MNEWLASLKPGQVLKWGGVVFAYILAFLFILNIVLAMFGVYG